MWIMLLSELLWYNMASIEEIGQSSNKDGSQGIQTSSASRSYRRISAKEWERQKPRIYTLYIDEDRSLDDVIQKMKVDYQFEAK